MLGWVRLCDDIFGKVMFPYVVLYLVKLGLS